MRIAIVGAGITGLTAAYHLSKAGHQVYIFEANSKVGGLAAGFKDEQWQWPLEYHYHHIFTSDMAIQELAQEIGAKINFKTPTTSVWYKNKAYALDGPKELWKFPHLSFTSKLKSSIWLAYLKLWPFWTNLETTTVQEWILKHLGKESWEKLWKPLMIGKFGTDYDRVAAVWFWARIHKRSKSLGYFEQGFQNFADLLSDKVIKQGAKLSLSTRVTGIYPEKATKLALATNETTNIYDRILVTGSSDLLLQLAHGLTRGYTDKISWLKSTGAVNLILALNQKFFNDDTYWLNINNTNMPFLAVVEHTNFIPAEHYGNDHILYVGNYLKPEHKYFNYSSEQLIEEYLPGLQKIHPGFSKNIIRKSWVCKARYAQPIITKRYSELLPPMQTPIPHLWWSSMAHVYPWDRGTNYAVEWGKKVADMILESESY